ncbi:MAG TPA: SRPBCC family protein [Rhizomicrobium sp.]|nr:SRPBCC family protein [Rhizomicrobium sp.]
MAGSAFVYVTYIRTTPEKLWQALTTPEFQRKFWFGMHQDSDFRKGSPWRLVFEDGRVADDGEVLEADPPNRLVLKWRNRLRPELTEEGDARCEMALETVGDATRLTITHSIPRDNSQLIEAVSGGWPKILASLKSLLETGEALDSIHSRVKA